MRARVAVSVLAVVSGALAAGCGPDFDPQSLVTAPRVLGVVATPPEIPFDGQSTLAPVIAFPEEVAGVTWGACPLSLGPAAAYACAGPELPLVGDAASATLDATALGPFLDGLAPAFAQVAPALKQVVAQNDTCVRGLLQDYDACVAAPGGDPAPCGDAAAAALGACLHQNGLDVVAHLTVTLADGRTLDAYKRVRLRDPAADRSPNQNPVLAGLLVDGQPVSHGDTVEAAPGAELALTPTLAADAVESYVDDTGATVTEEVFVSWFATAGELAYVRSVPSALDDRLTLPDAADMPAAITVWLVVHDDRYGASWLSFTVVPPSGGGQP